MSDNFYSYMYSATKPAEKSVEDEAPKAKEEGQQQKKECTCGEGCKCENCACDKSVKDAFVEFLGEEEKDSPKGAESKVAEVVSEDKK